MRIRPTHILSKNQKKPLKFIYMTTYEIRKEEKANYSFLYLFYEGRYVTLTAKIVTTKEEENAHIERLKQVIQNHKQTGNFELTTIVYSESAD